MPMLGETGYTTPRTSWVNDVTPTDETARKLQQRRAGPDCGGQRAQRVGQQDAALISQLLE